MEAHSPPASLVLVQVQVSILSFCGCIINYDLLTPEAALRLHQKKER